MISCQHWSRTHDRGKGNCALKLYGGKPYVGNCQGCIARGENNEALIPRPVAGNVAAVALWVRDTSSVPDGGWRYPGLNGYMVTAPNYNALYDFVRKHYEANDQPPPSQDDVIKYVCENLFVPCVDGNLPLVNNFTRGLPVRAPASCCGSK